MYDLFPMGDRVSRLLPAFVALLTALTAALPAEVSAQTATLVTPQVVLPRPTVDTLPDTFSIVLRRQQAYVPAGQRWQVDDLIDNASVAARLIPSYGTGRAYMGAIPGGFTLGQTTLTLPVGDTTGRIRWAGRFAPRHNVTHHTVALLCGPAMEGCVPVAMQGQGRYGLPYYDRTENLSGRELLDTLRRRVGQPYQQLSYNAARDRMYMDIDNQRVNGTATVNTLECVYTGRLVTGFPDRAAAQSNGNVNTEHTMPQSLFNSLQPMQADIHHIFVSDASANTIRGNHPMGYVPRPTWSVGGSKYAARVFEPRPQHKGGAARALLYFVTRYSDYNSFVQGMEPVLRFWSDSAQPTARERRRNDLIEQFQRNRNPYTDYPQFLERMVNLAGPARVADSVSLPLLAPARITRNSRLAGADTSLSPARFVIVNEGNASLLLTAGQLSASRYHRLERAWRDTLLPAGGYLTLVFIAREGLLGLLPMQGGQAIETVTFSVQARPSGQPIRVLTATLIDTLNVPLSAARLLMASGAASLSMAPSPAHGLVGATVTMQQGTSNLLGHAQWQAIGADGRLYTLAPSGLSATMAHGSEVLLDIAPLPPGIYVIQGYLPGQTTGRGLRVQTRLTVY